MLSVTLHPPAKSNPSTQSLYAAVISASVLHAGKLTSVPHIASKSFDAAIANIPALAVAIYECMCRYILQVLGPNSHLFWITSL